MDEPDSHDDDALVERAIRSAARLEPASAQARDRVRTAAHAQWRAALEQDGGVACATPATGAEPSRAPDPVAVLPAPAPAPALEVAARRARRARWPLALAASVAVAVVSASLLWQSPRVVGTTVAVAELVKGAVMLDSAGMFGDREAALIARGAVAARQRVTTGADGATLLRLGEGLTLRLAANSRLEVGAAGEVSLEAGTAYVDADPRFGAQPLTVNTPLGSVRHLGTQYSVSAGGGRLELAVREGLVQVSGSPAREPLRAQAGESLVIESAGTVSRASLGRGDARWGWLASLPLPFELDGASLPGFIDWYARETGVVVGFADAAGATRAREVRLSGSIAGLAPEEALRVVAASADLVTQRVGDQVVFAFR